MIRRTASAAAATCSEVPETETAAVLGADFDARARLVLKPVDGGASLADDAAGSEAGARHGLLHEIAAHLPAANLAGGAAVGPGTEDRRPPP